MEKPKQAKISPPEVVKKMHFKVELSLFLRSSFARQLYNLGAATANAFSPRVSFIIPIDMQ